MILRQLGGFMDSPLYLTEQEVPPGAVVLLCPPGSDEPAKDDNGPLPPLQCLIGGISKMGPRFYPVASIKPRPSGAINTNSYTDFHAGVRFVPLQTYDVADAPADTEFAVFQNGQRLLCNNLGCTTANCGYKLSVTKTANGCFKATVYYDCGLREKLITLPTDVVLVPITDIGAMAKKAKR